MRNSTAIGLVVLLLVILSAAGYQLLQVQG